MKKSSFIHLVLVSTLLVSCAKHSPRRRFFLRSDSTAPYSSIYKDKENQRSSYYAFRPYGIYAGGAYHRAGYYSSSISSKSNTGTNAFKGSVSRGGFGHSSYSVSS